MRQVEHSRRLHQPAPPERLWFHGQSEPDGIDLPVRNWMIASDEERRRMLFDDPRGESTRSGFSICRPRTASRRRSTSSGRKPARQRPQEAHPSHRGAHIDSMGQQRRRDFAPLRAGVCAAHCQLARRADRAGRPPAAPGAVGGNGPLGAGIRERLKLRRRPAHDGLISWRPPGRQAAVSSPRRRPADRCRNAQG
jgi:hypothetical protein